MPITLLYHDVVEPGRDDGSGFAGAGAARYKLTRAEFVRHLDALGRATGLPPALGEGLPARAGAGGWSLTFDDGGVSALDPTAGLLEERGWRGYFFVTTDRIGTPGFLSAGAVRSLHGGGHVVGSHSCSHPPRMSACAPARIREEWRRSREVLEDLLGAAVRDASVPGGFYSRAVAEGAAAAGYTTLFTSEPTTRSRWVGGCRVLGRYTVYRGMSAAAAARLVSRALPRWQQALLWNVKKVAKKVGGQAYVGAREWVLARSSPVPG
jgi:peptidoglycan/xylan/chitin deacetylase (PgdA/CDA1 family)